MHRGLFQYIYGDYFYKSNDLDQFINDRFNSDTVGKLMACGDEVHPYNKSHRNADKLKESTDVIDFRPWARTLEFSLEAHYGWAYADLVVQAIRHEKKPITHWSFADLIEKINQDEELREGVQNRLQPSDWNVGEKTRLLYRYLIPKLNKRLYDASNDIEDQNGL